MDPKSPEAIKLYMMAGGIVAGCLVGLVVVLVLINTCTWFNARCTQLTVKAGPGNTLLVTAGRFTYFYDGSRYIYAYGNNLSGTCPDKVFSGASATPVPLNTPVPRFCFSATTNENGEIVCSDPVMQQCARVSPVISNGKYSCDGGKTMLDSPTCCAYVQACPVIQTPEGAQSQQCVQPPAYDTLTGKYRCGDELYDVAKCCECSPMFQETGFSGKTTAHGDLYEPVFTVDAKSMQVVPYNGGVVCGMARSYVQQQFADIKPTPLSVNVPISTSNLNIYQLFDVLKRKGLFVVP